MSFDLGLLDTRFFIVTACADCDLPGYLIVRSRVSASTLGDLSEDAQRELGGLLARLEAAVVRVTLADRLYILRFSEAFEQVHFHLFPRSADLAAQWRTAYPRRLKDGNIDGPLLFAWARERFHVEAADRLSAQTRATVARIKIELL